MKEKFNEIEKIVKYKPNFKTKFKLMNTKFERFSSDFEKSTNFSEISNIFNALNSK